MSFKKRLLLWLCCSLLGGMQTSVAQDCIGPLNILMNGSSTADSLTIEIEATGITCASENNGSLSLTSSGGNPSYIYNWSDIMTNDSIRESLPEGTYFVTITDASGCSEVASWTIEQLNPNNSSLAIEDGCGVCVINDGESSYFFNEETRYIASLADNADAQGLGSTEVCLYMDNTVQSCGESPYLQRQWSVDPNDQQYACLKLYFSKAELDNLAAAVPNETVTGQQLIDNQRLCLTALSGGSEDCSSFGSMTVYSMADAPPLVITEEDAALDIWSVEVCTDAFATFYLNVCDFSLPVELLYFDGHREEDRNLLYWETASETNTAYFELQKSNFTQAFTTIATINATGNSTNTQQYNYIDPEVSEVDYYRLKIVDEDGSFEYSNIVVIQSTPNIPSRLYPSLFSNRIFYETELPFPDELAFTVYDAIGQRAFYQAFQLGSGAHQLTLKLDHLPAGHYFVQLVAGSGDRVEAFKVVKE